ncbi:hypothetical protein ACJRO7_028890 [Eucalyptus globulus]|uniref:Uncharacterized protein n=1 Tax=Eucalyptus globulus TaxID=34317 RepID=A0ABD3JW31_EUCGL
MHDGEDLDKEFESEAAPEERTDQSRDLLDGRKESEGYGVDDAGSRKEERPHHGLAGLGDNTQDQRKLAGQARVVLRLFLQKHDSNSAIVLLMIVFLLKGVFLLLLL